MYYFKILDRESKAELWTGLYKELSERLDTVKEEEIDLFIAENIILGKRCLNKDEWFEVDATGTPIEIDFELLCKVNEDFKNNDIFGPNSYEIYLENGWKDNKKSLLILSNGEFFERLIINESLENKPGFKYVLNKIKLLESRLKVKLLKSVNVHLFK